MKYKFLIGGEAGFGIMTTGLFFAKIVNRLGYYSLDYVAYPSLVRGGHNAYEVDFDDQPVLALKEKIDFLVCLNKDTYHRHRSFLEKEAIVIYDRDEFQIDDQVIKVNLPWTKILKELNGQLVMKNTIALGAVLALLGGEVKPLFELIEDQFKDKGQTVIEFNQRFAQAGYDYIYKNYSSLIRPVLRQKATEDKLVISGNEAFSLGSVVADCRLYAAYPMTPSSSVLATLASWQDKTGMVVRHAEDEISVINTALGASFAGVRAAVGTSGGGFALMVESVSFAGIAEIPIVIFLAQRPGPATGMPTWTEQGDLLFTIFAGHGEFPKIVLAPGDQEEMFELTLKAFNLADIYQIPVIILSDMYLSEGHCSFQKTKINQLINYYQINRGKLRLKPNENQQLINYLRYQLTNDGISERILPGVKGFFYQANSYEHLEDGHTTEESPERIKQVNKREKKWQTYLEKDFQLPNYYGDQKAEIIFVAWGSIKGIVLEAQRHLKEKGINTGFWHFNHLYPLNQEKLKSLFDLKKRYILVENNSWGQLSKLLMMTTGFEIKEKILRYDGRPVSVSMIINNLVRS